MGQDTTTSRPNLIAERINRGLGPAEAARQIGVSEQTLTAAESGVRKPYAKQAFKIASFYGFKVTDIWPVDEVAA